MKLALGTAQFGFDYGINNKKGKISKKEVFKILKYAASHKIDTLDTAHSYGDSESAIGDFIKKNKADFKIVSKCSSKSFDEPEKILQESLNRLSSNKIYGYLIHDFDSFLKNPGFYSELQKLKEQRKIEKTGFSLYHPKEAEYLLEKKVRFDLVQVPYSIFDQRFAKIFHLLKQKNVEIHVRSIFLQGLIFKCPGELEGNLSKMQDKLQKLKSISREINIPVSALCINFAILNEDIDKVIVGIDDLKHLQENISVLEHKNKIKKIYDRLAKLQEYDENIILPFNWK